MEQKHPCRARPCNHFSQPSQHLVAVLGWIDGTAVTSISLVGRGRIEGKDADIGCLQGLRHCNGPLKMVQVLVERAIDGNFPDGRANGGNADTVRVQRFLDPGYLLIGEIQYIRIPGTAQVQEVDVLGLDPRVPRRGPRLAPPDQRLDPLQFRAIHLPGRLVRHERLDARLDRGQPARATARCAQRAC